MHDGDPCEVASPHPNPPLLHVGEGVDLASGKIFRKRSHLKLRNAHATLTHPLQSFQETLVLQGRRPLRSVTWLAMLAMALIVVMPVLSRSIIATATSAEGDCPIHQAAGAKHPQVPADPTERCSYCVLLNHTPLLASGTVVYLAPVAPVLPPASIHRVDDKPALPRLSAEPRGPPHIS